MFLPKFLCWSPKPRELQVGPCLGTRSLQKYSSESKVITAGCNPTGLASLQRGEMGTWAHTQREGHVGVKRPEEMLPHGPAHTLTVTSGLQSCEMTRFCCLSH